eukprot:jgi/Psemu1/20153/gm1.20153_g
MRICGRKNATSTPDDFASSVFIRKSKKPEDASEKLGLTNTPTNGPLSSGLVPAEVLDNQVMHDPSVEPMEGALIGWELVNNDDNDDSVSDDNCFSSPYDEDDEQGIDSEVPPSLSVHREGNNMAVDDSPPDSNNKAIMTANAGRHVSDTLKVKIKLMKIMWNQSIPLVAEKKLSRVMKDIYAIVPAIEGDGSEPLLIDWCYKKSICADVAGRKQIYHVRSFRKALHSLLTNVTLVKEENLSLPHAEDPTLPVQFPEL